MITLAIQPDNQRLTSGKSQSFSTRWVELSKAAGVNTRLIDVYERDLLSQVQGCDGFLWWFAHPPGIRNVGQRVLLAVEHGLGIPTFPNWKTIWHFDDKVAQKYLLDAAGIRMPQTWVFWDEEKALQFCRQAKYPLVLKLAAGIVSANVRMVADAAEAEFWVSRLFGGGLTGFDGWPRPRGWKLARRRLGALRRALLGHPSSPLSKWVELQRGYVLLQEFVPGNDFDTRITIIGNRAFGFRRFNRPGDFRASGSGMIDWNPTKIEPRKIHFAFEVAKRLGTQSLAVDILENPHGSLVMNEISYYYEGWAVASCPGHWTLDGSWQSGQLAPEDAIFEDFMQLVRRRREPGVLA